MSTVHSIGLQGLGGVIVDVECRISRGLPALIFVGLAARAVTEAKERVRSAFAASGLKLPPQRITINLAPADLPKDGTGFDLSIAVSILLASHPNYRLEDASLVFGELGLDGQVKPIRGLIGGLLAGRSQGYKNFYIPAAQCNQAAVVPGVCVIPIQSLTELQRDLLRPGCVPRLQNQPLRLQSGDRHQLDFSQIAGQAMAKRGLEVAAAGGHHILLTGPPGTGKSMLAKALPAILPPLSPDQILEVSHLHSLTGSNFQRLVTGPPFRAPHHSASRRQIIGGDRPVMPGEISLAHHGILLLDELPEFNRSVIEALRQPLEERILSNGFPAGFMLVATANPCPCGHYGSRRCKCPAYRVQTYQQRLSGPVLDRIDICLEVEPTDHAAIFNGHEESSQAIRQRVIKARQRQPDRLNATLTHAQLSSLLTPAAKSFLDGAAGKLELSARGYVSAVKVARTIADLAAAKQITPEHIGEALRYRQKPFKP